VVCSVCSGGVSEIDRREPLVIVTSFRYLYSINLRRILVLSFNIASYYDTISSDRGSL